MSVRSSELEIVDRNWIRMFQKGIFENWALNQIQETVCLPYLKRVASGNIKRVVFKILNLRAIRSFFTVSADYYSKLLCKNMKRNIYVQWKEQTILKRATIKMISSKGEQTFLRLYQDSHAWTAFASGNSVGLAKRCSNLFYPYHYDYFSYMERVSLWRTKKTLIGY